MTGAQATFDGSTNPGTVVLRDFTGVEARASFATDAEAKLFSWGSVASPAVPADRHRRRGRVDRPGEPVRLPSPRSGLVLDLIDGAARDRFNLDKAVRAMRAAMKACEEACDD